MPVLATDTPLASESILWILWILPHRWSRELLLFAWVWPMLPPEKLICLFEDNSKLPCVVPAKNSSTWVHLSYLPILFNNIQYCRISAPSISCPLPMLHCSKLAYFDYFKSIYIGTPQKSNLSEILKTRNSWSEFQIVLFYQSSDQFSCKWMLRYWAGELKKESIHNLDHWWMSWIFKKIFYLYISST